MAYRDQKRVVISSSFKRQTSQGTALGNIEMDATLTCNLTRFERVPVFQVFRDCSALFLKRRQLQSRYYRFTLEFAGSPHILTGFFAGAMGLAANPTGTDPKTHAITMLGPSTRELSYHTMIIGSEDGTGEAWKYVDCAWARVRADANSGDGASWRGTVDVVASGARTSVTGFTFPACTDEAAALLYDGSFMLNSVERITKVKSLYCEYNNAVFVNDAPFVGGSKDIKQWLYGNENRSYLLGGNLLATDRPGDSLASLLYANDDVGTEVSNTSIRIGTTSNGLTINVPLADAAAEDSGETSAGEEGSTVMPVVILGKRVSGNANSPMSATAVLPNAQQSTAFEVAA